MIKPNDNNIRWTQKADMEMTLTSMLDLLYSDELMEGYKEYPYRLQPFLHYRELYKEHNNLLNDIVEMFFPLQNFTPSNINKQGKNEFYMFEVINAIFNIVWYYNIEKSRSRGYEKTLKEIEEARLYLSGYSDSSEMNKLINFPMHKNETIQQLIDMFDSINRPQQGKNIIKLIKKYFKITTVTSTKNKEMIDANKRMLEKIKKDHNLTDEELHKHPIFGQLQTKI